MRIPKIAGLIDRRILVNYRVDPDALRRFLPAPFEPLLVGGVGMAGICLIRLKHVRTRFWPAWLGLSSENAAHRIAVWWEERGQRREGVYIPRRDTSSRLNALVGGRVFPGEHHLAIFDVQEEGDRFDVRLRSRDGKTRVAVAGSVCDHLPADSAFDDLSAASEFFARGSLGYSATKRFGVYDGLELRMAAWRVEALDVERAHSSFFEDESIFPAGSAQFDCALLMRGIEHEWHAREPLCCAGGVEVRAG